MRAKLMYVMWLYNMFLSYTLTLYTNLQRCFFGGLGPSNFMHTGPSRYDNYQICDEEMTHGSLPVRYFDAIDTCGNAMVVMILYEA
jgi:hypothetical protein